MLLIFSRPIEFPGVFAFYYSIIGFFIVALAGELTRRVVFRLKSKPVFENEAVRSRLAGFAVLGFAFFIGNLMLAIPVIILLFFIQISIIEPTFDSSDAAFHRIDHFLTVSIIGINLLGYFLAVKTYHRKIYGWFLKRSSGQAL